MTYRCCRGRGGGHLPPLSRAAQAGSASGAFAQAESPSAVAQEQAWPDRRGAPVRHSPRRSEPPRPRRRARTWHRWHGRPTRRAGGYAQVVTLRSGRDAAQTDGTRTRDGQRRPVLPRVRSWFGGTASRSLAGCCPRGCRPVRCDRPRQTGVVRRLGTADRGAGCAHGFGASQGEGEQSGHYRSRARVSAPSARCQRVRSRGPGCEKGADAGAPQHRGEPGCWGAQPLGGVGSLRGQTSPT